MIPVSVITHPLAGNCLGTLRSKDTGIEDFRRAMDRLGTLLAVEATRDLGVEEGSVTTPLDVQARCSYVKDGKILLVPILRAGLGLLNSFLSFLPGARVGHIGVSRDHTTLEAIKYLDTVPTEADGFDSVFILDPMLATGNSSVASLKILEGKGYSQDQLTLVCAFSVKPGIEQVQREFPGVKIITAAIDPELNEKAYTVPGLGDAGDRLYLL